VYLMSTACGRPQGGRMQTEGRFKNLMFCGRHKCINGWPPLEIVKQTVTHLEEISYDFIQISGLYLHLISTHTLHCIPTLHTKNCRTTKLK